MEYELIDFGGGRKLESCAGVLVDRPCPAAEFYSPKSPDLWTSTDAKYVLKRAHDGYWEKTYSDVDHWNIDCGFGTLSLECAPSGAIGIFPEQKFSWDYILANPKRYEGKKLLNLFAYTGATTLALARVGAHVTHVDSAASAIRRAKGNADRSGLGNLFRGIIEDVRGFVGKEIKRGNQYDGIVVDPPSFGHGEKGQMWKVTRDLPDLLMQLAQLAKPEASFLMTYHTLDLSDNKVGGWTSQAYPDIPPSHTQRGDLTLSSKDGRELKMGRYLMW